jgi:hypothetical protein
MRENDEFLAACVDTFARRRGMKDFNEHPVLWKYIRLPVQLAQHQNVFTPEYLLPWALRPKSPIFEHYVRHCTHQAVRSEFERMRGFTLRDQLTLLEPGERQLQAHYGDPTIMAQTSKEARWDKVAFQNNCGIQVILGGHVSRDALRNCIESDFQEDVFLRRQGLVTTSHTYIKDEVNNYGLAGTFDAEVVSTTRYLNFDSCYITQTLGFQTEDIARDILQSTDHYWLAMGDPATAKLAAEDLLGSLDEHRVHHETSRTVLAGHHYEERRTRARTDDGTGNHRETETVSTVPVAQYTQQMEQHYQQGHEQLLWRAKDLRLLPTGTCWVCPAEAAPYLMRVPQWRDPWAFPGLAQEKAIECIQKVKEYHRDLYETPRLVEPTVFETAAPARPPAPTTTPMRRNATKGSVKS